MSVKELSETISKLGTFGIAAVITAVLAAVPVAITLDSRYAKEKVLHDQMEATNKKLEEQIGHLQAVNGQLQVLLTIVVPSRPAAALPTLPESVAVAAPVKAAPAITPDQQRAIDAQKPKEVVITSLKNKTIETGEQLSQTLQSVKKQ